MLAFLTLWAVVLFFGPVAQEPSNNKQDGGVQTSAEAGSSREEEELDRLKGLLAAGRATTDDILSSTEWSHLRAKPRFRRAIREAARSAKAVIVPSDEPGTPLVVRGIVRDESGAPVSGALIYVYQASAVGSYSTRGGNTGTIGDSLNPRLFGYIKTDAGGKYEFRSIRPGQYPGDGPPAHIHYEITAPGFQKKVTELMFEDDSRMTSESRKLVVEAGFVIATPAKGEDGVQRATGDWTLER